MSTALNRLRAQILAVVEAVAPPPNPSLQRHRELELELLDDLGIAPLPVPPVVPPDRHGVLERLVQASDRVAWVGASLVYGNQNRRLAGLCSVSSPDIVEVQQTGAPRRDATVVLRQDDSIAALTDPTSALRTLGLDTVQPLSETDRAGQPFQRFGSLPRRHGVSTNRAEEVFFFPVRNASFVIDIWTDDAGRSSRIRMLTADGNIWAELAFLWGVDTMPYLVDSPTLANEPAGSQWAGLEPVDNAPPPELRVALDPDGRPYDVVPLPDVSISTTFVGALHASDGKVAVVDGNALEYDLNRCRRESNIVDFGGPVDLGITVIFERLALGDQVLGIRLDRPGTTVHQWGAFEPAYSSGGNVGGITTNDVLIEAERRGDSSLSDELTELTELTESGNYDYAEPVVMSLLGISFADTIHFSAGERGGPMTRGFDDRGAVVSLYVFDHRYPFRLAIPDGTPPSDVTAREDQFIECMQGRRPIMPSGDCPTDDQLDDPRIWP